MQQSEDFALWWESLVDLATDLRRENYLRTKDYHRGDWIDGLTIGQVIEYRVGEALQRQSR